MLCGCHHPRWTGLIASELQHRNTSIVTIMRCWIDSWNGIYAKFRIELQAEFESSLFAFGAPRKCRRVSVVPNNMLVLSSFPILRVERKPRVDSETIWHAYLKVPKGAVACRRNVSLMTDSSTGSLVKSALSPHASAPGFFPPE